jgi:glutaredoxin-like protein
MEGNTVEEMRMGPFMDKQGQTVPQVNVWVIEKEPHARETDSLSLFKGKRVAFFALPGAFTPTCSNMHVPRFNALADAFRHSGIDEIYCLSVNDPFVMQAWRNDQHAENIRFISDPDARFTEAMGMLTDHGAEGLGKRSWRYSMIVDDGVVEKMFIEPSDSGKADPFEVSDADTLLAYINPQAPALKPVAMLGRRGCPFCARAKELLDGSGFDYEVIWLSDSVTLDTVRAISGRATVPQVFMGGRLIGGSEELEEFLEKRGTNPEAR